MARGSSGSPYRFPVVRPAMPGPEAWVPFLRESYDRHWFSNFGPVVLRFEAALAARFGGMDDAFVTASSATCALAACLIAERVTGTVLVPAFTFPASVAAIRMAGGTPMLVDVDGGSWACDAEKLEHALDRTGAEAVMLVAPFGIAQDFSAHVACCVKRGVKVVIDNAAGLGGDRREQHHRGVYVVYSLHATKPFAIGEGGAILASADRVAALRAALNFDLPWRGEGAGGHGINGKMPEFAAAVGMAVLNGYDAVLAARRPQASRYVELFDRFDDIAIQRGIADAPWQVFPCLLPSAAAAENFVAETARHGLEVRRYYRPSLSRWGGIAVAGDCAVSESLAERMVCLPIYSQTSDGEIAAIHRIVGSCLPPSLRLAA